MSAPASQRWPRRQGCGRGERPQPGRLRLLSSAAPFPAVAHGWFRSNSRSTDGSIFSIWLSGNGATPVAEPAPLDTVGDGALLAAAFAALAPLDAVGDGGTPVAEPAPLDAVDDGATPVAEPAPLDAAGDGALLAAAFAAPAPLDTVGDGATPLAEPALLDAVGDGALLAAAFAALRASRPRRAPSS
jgi:hypothetical protein